MKKLLITAAVIFGISMTSFADGNEGGMFGRAGNSGNGNHSGYVLFGAKSGESATEDPVPPMLPNHGETGNQPAPLGSGIALLAGLGAAYLVAKKRREE